MRKTSWRFFIVFLLQGGMVLAIFQAVAYQKQTGDASMVTFTAGAALMLFVLMLIIWLMSVISADK